MVDSYENFFSWHIRAHHEGSPFVVHAEPLFPAKFHRPIRYLMS